MEATIDHNYHLLIESLDPAILTPKLKAYLTIGSSDRYFQKVNRTDLFRQEKMEELLGIVRSREEMWKPFISACRECGYKYISNLLEAGLHGERRAPEPNYERRDVNKTRNVRKPRTSASEGVFPDAIDNIYAKFIETVDPNLIIPRMKACLNIGKSERYFEKLNMPGRPKHERNEDLLNIIRHREEMWDPFIAACRECGYTDITEHFEVALAKAKTSSSPKEDIYNRRRFRSSEESECPKMLSCSSVSRSHSVDVQNPRTGHWILDTHDRYSSLQYEYGSCGQNTKEDDTYRRRIEVDQVDTEQRSSCPQPEIIYCRSEAEVPPNLQSCGKPDLPPKVIPGNIGNTGTREQACGSVDEEYANIPVFDELLSRSSSHGTEQVLSTSLENDMPKESVYDKEGTEDILQDSDVESGHTQQNQIYVNSSTDSNNCSALPEFSYWRLQRMDNGCLNSDKLANEGYRSDFCVSEASENPSVHERLSQEAMKAEIKKGRERSQDGGERSESPPSGGTEAAGVESRMGNRTPGDGNTVSWRSVMFYSVQLLASSINVNTLPHMFYPV